MKMADQVSDPNRKPLGVHEQRPRVVPQVWEVAEDVAEFLDVRIPLVFLR